MQEKEISQKIIDYAIWYYINFFPSKRQIFDKLKEKFWPESEKWKKYWWISDEEIFFVIDKKLKNFLQEENILRAKIKNFLKKWKNLNYIKKKLFEKKFDKNDVEKILNEEFLNEWKSLLDAEKLEKNILNLRKKWKSKKFIQQKFCERQEDFEFVNWILEKVFSEDVEWEKCEIDRDFENLKIEFEKIKKKKVKNKKTWNYEEISREKIVEKLLGKGFVRSEIKMVLEVGIIEN